MRRRKAILIMCLCTICIYAQDYMRIHHKSGTHTDIAVTTIDSITFVDKTDADVDDEQEVGEAIIGSWIWGNQEAGYYELLTFKKDHTYTGYDNYFTYGFDTQTYGWYSYYGAMITLQSNGFGYKRKYNWFVTALTENALEVMTKMGSFTYYKLQEDVIHLHVGESKTLKDGESIIFFDDVIVKVVENNLLGVVSGVTYILKMESSGIILAYRVKVE